jgi:hypothetical protein
MHETIPLRRENIVPRVVQPRGPFDRRRRTGFSTTRHQNILETASKRYTYRFNIICLLKKDIQLVRLSLYGREIYCTEGCSAAAHLAGEDALVFQQQGIKNILETAF